ncbi:MAG: hypothetical protein EAZ95_06440 [Bacteroidetes bacterium]|nr:MAG: hypothetical protein EAZ95_06440 [Bacteroidota bacterium]
MHFFQFILPENPVFGRYTIELGSAILATFASLFAKSFLNIRIYSKWLDIALSIIAILGALCIVGLLFLPVVWIMHVLYNILSILVIVLLISGFISWRKKNRYAGYYILAWVGYLVGGICRMWADQAILPWNVVTHHGTEVGSAMEVMLLSLALSSRYNVYRKEKENAIKRALEVETEAKETLEEKVNKRTQQLQEANEELQKNEQKIIEQHNLLYEKNNVLEFYKDKISKSISTALIIQTAILPTYQRMNSLFKEHFVIFMPKDTVSGDFYWVHEVDGKRILLLSDCTGHGISGAFMTMISYSILNKIAELNETDSASDMLQKLHEEIRKSLQQTENNNNYGMDASLVIIESQNSDWCITFSGAKRPLYYITPQSELTKVEANRQSIGGFDKKNVFFEERKIILPNDTLLYFTSDGYADQNNVYRKKYSEKKLIEYIQKICNNPLSEQKNLFQKEIENYMTETEQRDDILLLGIKL